MSAFQKTWAFLRVRKRYWLTPIIIVLLLFLLLVLLGRHSDVRAPFIYSV
ncbi:MAG TPA: DUF5989 family protein [Candidatus Hydrogenedentes bacterium]|nr:DUF5989 family protein [Candidatus Hydrogenedentota bacterium]HOS02336.1 DUF5989 family protein [Candidatus Hydrogenedentota bacterium]